MLVKTAHYRTLDSVTFGLTAILYGQRFYKIPLLLYHLNRDSNTIESSCMSNLQRNGSI
jgi:hypothetical protein